MQGTATFGELRDRLELILSINTGDSYIDSTSQGQDINEAYQLTAYKYNWPSLLTRAGIVVVANVDRYSLPSDFRKARTIKFLDRTLLQTEMDFIKQTHHSYVIDQIQDDIIIQPIPTTASTAYTFTNAETAASAVTIELDTISGLGVHDEIFVDAASLIDEYTIVSATDTATTTITARLDSNKSASDILYKTNEIIDIKYYRIVTLLSASGDKTLLPGSIDFIMLHAASALAFERLEMFGEADKKWATWDRMLSSAWLGADRSSTGSATEFTL